MRITVSGVSCVSSVLLTTAPHNCSVKETIETREGKQELRMLARPRI